MLLNKMQVRLVKTAIGNYELWRSGGAKFITEPKTHTHEIRCYMRDPDGYLIEVGQSTDTATPLESFR